MQFKGELKQQYGKFTDDDLKQIEGNYDKFVGKAQERYGDKKDELMKWADAWHEKSAPKTMEKKSRLNGAIHERRLTTHFYISIKEQIMNTRYGRNLRIGKSDTSWRWSILADFEFGSSEPTETAACKGDRHLTPGEGSEAASVLVVGPNRDNGLIQTPFIWVFDAQPAKMAAAAAAKEMDTTRVPRAKMHLEFIRLLP